MNSLIFSLFVLILLCFRRATRSHMAKGQVREVICAHWCADAVFAIFGIIISFCLYHYSFLPFLTVRNVVLVMLYLGLTVLFVLLAPSGIALLTGKRSCSKEELMDREERGNKEALADKEETGHKEALVDAADALLGAEYRFHETMLLVRHFFTALLFLLPILFTILSHGGVHLPVFSGWSESEICGGFCFAAFLVLLPMSLRQSFFWLKNLRSNPSEQEDLLLQKYCAGIHYKRRNRRL